MEMELVWLEIWLYNHVCYQLTVWHLLGKQLALSTSLDCSKNQMHIDESVFKKYKNIKY